MNDSDKVKKLFRCSSSHRQGKSLKIVERFCKNYMEEDIIPAVCTLMQDSVISVVTQK